MKTQILVVEDEPNIAEPLAEGLQREGFDPTTAGTAADALRLVEDEEPDLVLLDLMLPDGDGRDVCRAIRKRSAVPIIMLTARGEEVDRVVGLELGADDYVVKPFSLAELVARIRAVLRRSVAQMEAAEPADARRVAIGDIALDRGARTVTKGPDAVELAPREFDLLRLLMDNAGKVVSREDIMDEVWDPHWFGSTKTLDVHVSWLRKKLEDDPANPRYIQTVRGVGFKFASADELEA